jgi:hypothetical protein
MNCLIICVVYQQHDAEGRTILIKPLVSADVSLLLYRIRNLPGIFNLFRFLPKRLVNAHSDV